MGLKQRLIMATISDDLKQRNEFPLMAFKPSQKACIPRLSFKKWIIAIISHYGSESVLLSSAQKVDAVDDGSKSNLLESSSKSGCRIKLQHIKKPQNRTTLIHGNQNFLEGAWNSVLFRRAFAALIQ
jgi:hypothetical protein